MVKYFCDDCGSELTEYDSIAHQLDMTGHVYCHGCIDKHKDLYKPVSWTSVPTKDIKYLDMKVYEPTATDGEIFRSGYHTIIGISPEPPKYTLIDTYKKDKKKTK